MIIKERDYKKDYKEFWKYIVENDDGTLNKDQVMRELSDYSMVMENCASAYSEMTCGQISKQNTCFYEVQEIFFEKFIRTDCLIDDILEILKTDDIVQLKKDILNYFYIENSGDDNDR